MLLVAEGSKRGYGTSAISGTAQPNGHRVNFVRQREYIILLLYGVIINQSFPILYFQMLRFLMQFKEYAAVAVCHYKLLFFFKENHTF